jgi:eukaryotic-like serine/threonine-protein kinase
VDAALITEAESVLKLTDGRPFAQGGQKYVGRGTVAGEAVVLMVVEIAGTYAPVTLERARREVDLLARLDHANVVHALSPLVELGGTSPPTGVAWLEEYLDGDDLSQRLGSQWSWPDTLSMAIDVANGLAAMHAEKAVHRDLSPRNVRCTTRGYVLMDPGLARHLEESTLTGVFQPGTPGYMTPEHAAGTGRPIPASDVFGVGILMYQALAGVVPCPFAGDLDAYRKELRDTQVESIGSVRGDLGSGPIAIVDRCLQRQSGRRYIDGTELAEALEAEL